MKETLINRLEAVEKASLGNDRLTVLASQEDPDLIEYLNYALSSDITFNLKQIPDPIPLPGALSPYNGDEWWHELKMILDLLAERALTGNEAKEVVGSFLGVCSPLERKWTERVIKQDLRLNIGVKEVNKLFPGSIKVFEVPLADDYLKAKEFDGRWCIQPKLDGARCVAHFPGDKSKQVRLLSRTGKLWLNFESVRETLQRFNHARGSKEEFWLDGEIISLVDGRINFQALQHNLHRKSQDETGQLVYYVFDRVIGSWKQQYENYIDRFTSVRDNLVPAIKETTKADNIRVVESTIVSSPDHGYLRAQSHNFVDLGYEGAMARRADSPGKMKRSRDLLKVKTFLDDESEIVGFVEGTGRLVGMVGALDCKTKDGVDFQIGTGLDDAERTKLWSMRNRLYGLKVNYKYFEKTNDGTPRFPVYKGLRHKDDIG